MPIAKTVFYHDTSIEYQGQYSISRTDRLNVSKLDHKLDNIKRLRNGQMTVWLRHNRSSASYWVNTKTENQKSRYSQPIKCYHQKLSTGVSTVLQNWLLYELADMWSIICIRQNQRQKYYDICHTKLWNVQHSNN